MYAIFQQRLGSRTSGTQRQRMVAIVSQGRLQEVRRDNYSLSSKQLKGDILPLQRIPQLSVTDSASNMTSAIPETLAR